MYSLTQMNTEGIQRQHLTVHVHIYSRQLDERVTFRFLFIFYLIVLHDTAMLTESLNRNFLFKNIHNVIPIQNLNVTIIGSNFCSNINTCERQTVADILK